jgi:hypothetical protein
MATAACLRFRCAPCSSFMRSRIARRSNEAALLSRPVTAIAFTVSVPNERASRQVVRCRSARTVAARGISLQISSSLAAVGDVRTAYFRAISLVYALPHNR